MNNRSGRQPEIHENVLSSCFVVHDTHLDVAVDVDVDLGNPKGGLLLGHQQTFTRRRCYKFVLGCC